MVPGVCGRGEGRDYEHVAMEGESRERGNGVLDPPLTAEIRKIQMRR